MCSVAYFSGGREECVRCVLPNESKRRERGEMAQGANLFLRSIALAVHVKRVLECNSDGRGWLWF